jgi:hypothetical protein
LASAERHPCSRPMFDASHATAGQIPTPAIARFLVSGRTIPAKCCPRSVHLLLETAYHQWYRRTNTICSSLSHPQPPRAAAVLGHEVILHITSPGTNPIEDYLHSPVLDHICVKQTSSTYDLLDSCSRFSSIHQLYSSFTS